METAERLLIASLLVTLAWLTVIPFFAFLYLIGAFH